MPETQLPVSAEIASAVKEPSGSPIKRLQRQRMAYEYGILIQKGEIEAALGLVYHAYRRLGYIESNHGQVRAIRQHVLPTTEILVGRTDDEIVCTSTLVRDNRLWGLPMECIFREEVASRRATGIRLAEASCLAHHPDDKPPLSVVVRVMSLTIQVAARRDVDELLAVVHPHHVDFYRGFLGFEPFGKMKSYSAVNDNPATAIALDLRRMADNHPQGYKRAFTPPFSEETLRFRLMTPEAVRFLYDHLDAMERLKADDPCDEAAAAGG